LQTLIQLIDDGTYDKIVYIRQRIQRPHEPELGSLPGDKSEKLHKLLAPILDNLEAILSPYAVDEFIKTKVECSDIESLRGRSPLRSCLFCDEAQNCDLTALETIMTRRTECSKLVLAGDFKGQRDILDREFDAFELVCNEFEGKFPIIHLTKNDILRSETNKDVITGFERIKERLQLIGVCPPA
jgi:predicted ribonuclease YlaK